jgi:C-terminal processing protease CtpA/Prc
MFMMTPNTTSRSSLRRMIRASAAGFSLVALLAGSDGAHAQGLQGGFDDAARTAVVHHAAEALQQRYVFPDVGNRAAEIIEAALTAGNYAGEDPVRFALEMTRDLQSETHDKHVRVYTLTTPPPAASATVQSVSPNEESGIVRADRLAENIGYIEVASFPELPQFRPSLDQAMAALASTRALIIDSRRNHGGSPASEAYLASYFLDGKKRIAVSKYILRNPRTETFHTQMYWSSRTPESYAGKPVYVLTSRESISAGEAVAYDMRALGVAVIIGDPTGGGANGGGLVPLGHGMAMFVPIARAENPTTGTSWEALGVAPDVPAPAAIALQVALKKLGVTSPFTQIADLSKARLFRPDDR